MFLPVDRVWSLGVDSGALGSLILTNVRMIWVSLTDPTTNASVPWIQIKDIRCVLCETRMTIQPPSSSSAADDGGGVCVCTYRRPRNTRVGRVTVVSVNERAGGSVIGLRTDAADDPTHLSLELQNLWQVNLISKQHTS